MVEYKVITEALRAEAPKWYAFADVVEVIKREVGDAGLGVTAFFCGSPIALGLVDLNAELHQTAYEGYRSFMEQVLAGALVEFPQIAEALGKNAETYDRGEEVTGEMLDKIWDAAKW